MPSLIQHYQWIAKEHRHGALPLLPNPPGHSSEQGHRVNSTKPHRQMKALSRQALKGTSRWARLWIKSHLPLQEQGELKWKFGCCRQAPAPAVPHLPRWVCPTCPDPQPCPSARLGVASGAVLQEGSAEFRHFWQRNCYSNWIEGGITEKVIGWDDPRQKGAIGRELQNIIRRQCEKR